MVRCLPVFLLGGAIALLQPSATLAQIVPDNSLGDERSQIQSNVLVNGEVGDRIEGGSQRGDNLFHSFESFNITDGQRVYFAVPGGVDRILTRVTGVPRSEINGTLGTAGTADLFLINPNGILFGPNTRLDIRGSFIATTANSVLFNNGFAFSATTPQLPPVLTINVPTGLQFGQISGSIQTQPRTRLQAADGETLALVGGALNIERSLLQALGGRIDIGSVNGLGIVELDNSGSTLQLRFPNNLPRADFRLTNGARLNVAAAGGGDIVLTAHNMEISGSEIFAGIDESVGVINPQAGTIELNATGQINATNESFIDNSVVRGGIGQSGDIRVTAGALSVREGTQFVTANRGVGEAGNIIIDVAGPVLFDGFARSGFSSGAFSRVFAGGANPGGNISITAASLALTNSGQLNTRLFGQGNAGDIVVTVRDTIFMDAGVRDFAAGGISSRVERDSIGNGGDITITARSLVAINGAQIVASTRGTGNSGNITIRAIDDVSFDGEGVGGVTSTGAFSRVDTEANGRGGNINIVATTVSVTQGASLTASTRGVGNAGGIVIAASDSVLVDGASRNGFPSSILTSVDGGAIGTGGRITLNTQALTVTNRGQINAGTAGQGDAGNIRINASNFMEVTHSGRVTTRTDSDDGIGGAIAITTDQMIITDRAALDATTTSDSLGGSITLNANSLEANNSGQLTTTTLGRGQSGSINLNISDRITLSGVGTGILANTAPGSTGNGGTIVIDPRLIILRDRAQIAVNSQGSGTGGDIQIAAGILALDTNSNISAETVSNTGGNIRLDIEELLLLRRESTISTTAGTAQGNGDGGDILANVGFVVAVPSENSDITANAFRGRGGNIAIATQGLFGIAPRQAQSSLTSDITATSELGIDGSIELSPLETDPLQGVTALPGDFRLPLLAQGCRAVGNQESRFVNSGRGGLPTNPADPLVVDNLWQDLGETEQSAIAPSSQNTLPQTTESSAASQPALVEAQGWIVRPDGVVMLTASAPTATPHGVGTAIECESVLAYE